MKKALMYASVASMIQQFNMGNIKLLKELGYKVDVACNFEFGSTISKERIEKLKEELKAMDVDYYHIPVPRKTTDFKNLKESYKITKDLMNKEKYDLIHCHSPIGGIICRLANKNSICYDNTKMIYTAHGFHFFKGNNLIKNFIFRNIEKLGARYTDVLITINKEDYEAAKKFKLKHNGSVKKIPGVGIDVDKINSIKENRDKLIDDLGIDKNSFLLISVGEVNENKNHKIIINSLPMLPANIHYLICGIGPLCDEYDRLSKELHVRDRVHLLGYKNNVIEIVKSCDVFVFPSKREGLGLAALEAMACGLPLITSNRHGILDYAENYVNSLTCDPNNLEQFQKAINFLYHNKDVMSKFSQINIEKSKKYDKKIIDSLMFKIYSSNEN